VNEQTTEEPNCIWEADSFHTDREVFITCRGDVQPDKKVRRLSQG